MGDFMSENIDYKLGNKIFDIDLKARLFSIILLILFLTSFIFFKSENKPNNISDNSMHSQSYKVYKHHHI